jgi:hypothetical protein
MNSLHAWQVYRLFAVPHPGSKRRAIERPRGPLRTEDDGASGQIGWVNRQKSRDKVEVWWEQRSLCDRG